MPNELRLLTGHGETNRSFVLEIAETQCLNILYICYMSLQYLSDETGHVIAVQLPIDEWEQLKLKYPELETPMDAIPDWQKRLIDTRLQAISENAGRVLPGDSLLDELDHDVE